MLETGELSPMKSYISIGDEYTDKKEAPLHHIKGKRQFLTTGPKSGQTGPTFGAAREIKPLYDGEPYSDMAKFNAMERKNKQARFLNPRGFVPSSPGKKPTGAGDVDGAFGGYEHMDDGLFTRPRPKRDPEGAKRNILTSPPKSGGPGFPGITLGPLPEYKADTFGEMEARKRAERAAHKAKMGDRKPFTSMSAAKGEPLDKTGSSGISAVYGLDDRCLPPRPDPEFGKTPKQIAEEHEAKKGFEKPFRQSSPGKVGFNSTFQPFPERTPEVYDPTLVRSAMTPSRLLSDRKRKERMSAKMADRPAWKPNSGPKSGLVRSTALSRIHRATITRSVTRGRS